ncbi:hypothetical protein Pcinc_038056 [Petrolisthes cinctipes]|uniref:Uncharacterized protein n=1 Tax=Petrolisthes cinctipes TaxID=88211 RepID=A0AAE1BRT6_PETCI|nr:hypothetical protein Pcinc_038056 [Petrolisthes cinctipes]
MSDVMDHRDDQKGRTRYRGLGFAITGARTVNQPVPWPATQTSPQCHHYLESRVGCWPGSTQKLCSASFSNWLPSFWHWPVIGCPRSSTGSRLAGLVPVLARNWLASFQPWIAIGCEANCLAVSSNF